MSDNFEKLEELSKWTEANGQFFRSRHPWLAGDWRTLLEALNLLLSAERRLPCPPTSPGSPTSDHKVVYTLSFDSTTQLAEEALGIPLFIVEADLDVKQPTSRMAVLTYTVSMKHSLGPTLSGFNRSASNALEDESKVAIDIKPPDEAPTCRQCNERPFFAERVVIDKNVWHRRCFRCYKCSKQLHRGAFRQSLNQTHAYECLEHEGRSLIDDGDSKVVKCVEKAIVNSRPALLPKPNLTKKSNDDECDHYSSADPPPVNSSLSTSNAGDSLKSGASLNPFGDDDDDDAEQPAKSLVNRNASPPAQTTVAKPTIQVESPTASPESSMPVAPPRRKRQSQQNSQQNSQQSSRSGSLNRILDASPKKAVETKPDICDYPDFLNPFGSDDGNDSDTASDYDEALNPFADEADDDSSATALSDADSLSKSMSGVRLRPNPPAVPAKPRYSLQPNMSTATTNDSRRRSTPSKSPTRTKRQAPPPPSQLPGDSDRPKSNPPPPPKPPRPSAETLQRRKKRQAPPPPMPLKRKVKFTDHKTPESLDEVTSALTALDAEQEKLEVLGKAAEKELLFVIEQSPKDWERHVKVEQWIQLVEQKCDLIRKESLIICNWLEMYLNELHSETEYQLRCLIEKPESEKTDADIARETKLLESLLDIISQKSRLVESQDTSNTRHMSDDEDTIKKPSPDKSKSKKLKIRIKKLRKKLGEGKKTKSDGK